MEHKVFPSFLIKAEEPTGIVEHAVAIMGNLDKGGDIIHPGAFTKTLAERGNKIRVLDAHNTDSIQRVIGKPIALREVGRDELPYQVKERYPDATGALIATTQFLMDTPEGKGAFVRIQSGAVDEYSIGYDPIRGGTDYSKAKAADGSESTVRNLRELRLWEYGPVIWGMNPATMTMSAKADEPTESKPAPDVTENSVRMRQRAPGDFEEGTFRTITIGTASDGIQAVIGKLKGETSTTIQSYIFDKDKWSVSEAQKWIDDHKKDALPEIEEKAGRMISAANAERLTRSLSAFLEVLEAAGIDIPGYSRSIQAEPGESVQGTPAKTLPTEQIPSSLMAGSGAADQPSSPTEAEIEALKLEMMNLELTLLEV